MPCFIDMFSRLARPLGRRTSLSLRDARSPTTPLTLPAWSLCHRICQLFAPEHSRHSPAVVRHLNGLLRYDLLAFPVTDLFQALNIAVHHGETAALSVCLRSTPGLARE